MSLIIGGISVVNNVLCSGIALKDEDDSDKEDVAVTSLSVSSTVNMIVLNSACLASILIGPILSLNLVLF